MLDVLLALITVAALAGALVPIWQAARYAMHALRYRRRVWPWLLTALLCIAALTATFTAAVVGLVGGLFPQFFFGLNGGSLLPLVWAAATLQVGPWGMWLLCRHGILKAWPADTILPLRGAQSGV